MAGNTNREIIEVQVKGTKKAKNQLDGVNNTLSKMAKRVGLASAAYFGATGLINGFKTLTEEGSKLKNVTQAFDNMGSKIGFTSSSLQKLKQATNGTISEIELMTKANNAMALSIVHSDEEMAELFDTAQRLGAALGVDTTRALDSLVTGMGRQSKLMLDNLGIMVDAKVAYDTYAASVGKSSNELDDNEKKIAFNNEAMRQARDIVNQMGPELETANMKMQELGATFSDMTASLGKALSPALENLTSKFVAAGMAVADFISVNLSDQLINEKQQFETLISVLTDVNSSTSSREMAIRDLEKSYAPYLKNINLEKTTTEDLIKLKNDVVTQMQEEIKQKLFAEQLREAEQKKQEASIKLYEAEQEQIKQATMTYNGYGGMVTHLGNQTGVLVLQRQKALEESEKELQAIKDSQVGYEEWLKTQNKVVKVKDADAKSTEKLTRFEKILAKVREQTTAKGATDEYVAALNSSKAHLIKQIMKHIPFPLNIPVAAGAGATIDKLFAKNNITAAQYGADFVTDGPQMMMVGEGSGPERVQVTPLVDPNLDGPQGSGMIINIQGSVIGTEQFTEDVLMPQIEEGLRLGNRI